MCGEKERTAVKTYMSSHGQCRTKTLARAWQKSLANDSKGWFENCKGGQLTKIKVK